MELFCKDLMSCLKKSTTYAHSFKSVPFSWETGPKKKSDADNYLLDKLILTERKVNVFLWYFVAWFSIIHQIFLAVRLIQSVKYGNHGFDFYILQLGYNNLFLMFVSFQIALLSDEAFVRKFMNRSLKLCKTMEDKFWTKIPRNGKFKLHYWQWECLMLNRMMFLTSLSLPFMLIPALIVFSYSEVFITSILPQNVYTITFGAIPVNVILNFIIWSTFIFCVSYLTTTIYVTIAILNELRNTKSRNTISELREPGNILNIYRCLQIQLIGMNYMLKGFLLLVLLDTLLATTVMGYFCLIRFHDRLIPATLIFLIIGSIVGTMLILFVYIKFGEINQESKGVVNYWSRNLLPIPDGRDRKLFKKYLKTCAHLKIEMGEFGYFRKPNALRIVGKLVYYLTKSLVLSRGIV